MAKMLSLSIDVTKIDKNKLVKGEKGTYANLTIALNDDKDQFGNDVSCWLKQSKEETDNKSSKVYLGNGKVFWSSDSNTTQDYVNKKEEHDDLPW